MLPTPQEVVEYFFYLEVPYPKSLVGKIDVDVERLLLQERFQHIVPTSFSLRCQLPETLRLGVASLFQPVVIVNHSRLYISYLDKVLEIITGLTQTIAETLILK